MSKQISAKELAEIVTRLLTDSEGTGELDDPSVYEGFMTDIAEVVCKHCGGEVRHPASILDDTCYVGIHGNDSLPSAFGGIWREYDPEGQLFDTYEGVCSECGADSDQIIGCPDGAEICPDCFAKGGH